MAVYPNSARTAAGFMNVGRKYGPVLGGLAGAYEYSGSAKLGSRVGLFNPTSGQLDGYDRQPLLPRAAGAMASYNGQTSITLDAAGSLLNGGPVEGFASLDLSGTGNMSLIVFLEGDAAADFSAAMAGLNLTLSLSGTGTLTLTGSGGLTVVVPLEASAAAFTLSGSADLRGRLLLESGVDDTVLTAEAVAQAVWAAVAAVNDLPGTMGELLNASGAGGLSPSQATMLLELWRMRGLDPAAPVTVTVTSETAGTIELTITGDSTTTSTLTRQP
jgi:hypothetical protein